MSTAAGAKIMARTMHVPPYYRAYWKLIATSSFWTTPSCARWASQIILGAIWRRLRMRWCQPAVASPPALSAARLNGWIRYSFCAVGAIVAGDAPIHAFGNDAQKDTYLPKLASGEWIGCFGLTEPDHCPDPGGMKTRATKTKDGFILGGSKNWITNSPVADVFVIWAKTYGLPDKEDGNFRSAASFWIKVRRGCRHPKS